jgi:hypothetical protein
MNSTKETRESAPVLDAFDTLFNKRDYVAAERCAGARPRSGRDRHSPSRLRRPRLSRLELQICRLACQAFLISLTGDPWESVYEFTSENRCRL